MQALAPETSPKREVSAPVDSRHGLKLLLDLGPLLVFFVVYWLAGRLLPDPKQAIFWGTGFLIGATLVSLGASRLIFGRIAAMPLVTAALVTVFGSLTILLQDDLFIKIKPTILYTLFSVTLFAGLSMGKIFLKSVFSEVMKLTDEGWRLLTIRWVIFFAVLAGLNELIWRTCSESTWVTYKVFGTLPLVMGFAAAQIGLLKKYEAH